MKTLRNVKVDSNGSYITSKKNDRKRIKYLLSKGHTPVFPVHNTWVIINGQAFNGFSRTEIEELMNEKSED